MNRKRYSTRNLHYLLAIPLAAFAMAVSAPALAGAQGDTKGHPPGGSLQ